MSIYDTLRGRDYVVATIIIAIIAINSESALKVLKFSSWQKKLKPHKVPSISKPSLAAKFWWCNFINWSKPTRFWRCGCLLGTSYAYESHVDKYIRRHMTIEQPNKVFKNTLCKKIKKILYSLVKCLLMPFPYMFVYSKTSMLLIH